MPNFYVGTGTAKNTNDPNLTLRSGYNKLLPNINLDAQAGNVDVTQGNNTSGAAWGAFTACGGLIVRTNNDVYLAHSTPGGVLLTQEWGQNNSWLRQNIEQITRAIIIGFGADPQIITGTILPYFQNHNIPTVRIRRPHATALRASANTIGVFIISQIDYQHPLYQSNWDVMADEEINQN